MKKLFTFVFLMMSLPAMSFDALPTVPLSEISPMHDMQTMQAHKFRQEQIDYYNDVQTEKAKFKKKNQTKEQKIQEVKEQIQQAVDRKTNSYGKSQFVQENGQLKIKYSN